MATAKKATAKKVAAKKTPAPAKKAPVKKAATGQPIAKKAATAQKAAVKKVAAPAQKVAVKKTVAKKAPAKRSRSSDIGNPPDALKLLKNDHSEVRELFEQYQQLVDKDAGASERKELAEKICEMLTVHATIEEEIFYPAAREALPKADDLLDEAEVEHSSAKDLIAQIRMMQPDQDLYDAKVTVLGEYIDHHVEEEETEMFPKCRRAKMDLTTLGARLAERKSALLSSPI